jgi:hypothetical protein
MIITSIKTRSKRSLTGLFKQDKHSLQLDKSNTKEAYINLSVTYYIHSASIVIYHIIEIM